MIFAQALSFTEAQSGFAQRLIEKDYYCSLILADFEPLFAEWPRLQRWHEPE